METKRRIVCLAAFTTLAIVVLACSLLPSRPLLTADTPTAILENTDKTPPTPPVLAQTNNYSAIKLTGKEVAYYKALSPEERSGSWSQPEKFGFSRPTNRSMTSPDYVDSDMCFRCVSTP